jgi:hypothetical protein
MSHVPRRRLRLRRSCGQHTEQCQRNRQRAATAELFCASTHIVSAFLSSKMERNAYEDIDSICEDGRTSTNVEFHCQTGPANQFVKHLTESNSLPHDVRQLLLRRAGGCAWRPMPHWLGSPTQTRTMDHSNAAAFQATGADVTGGAQVVMKGSFSYLQLGLSEST